MNASVTERARRIDEQELIAIQEIDVAFRLRRLSGAEKFFRHGSLVPPNRHLAWGARKKIGTRARDFWNENVGRQRRANRRKYFAATQG